MNTAGDTRPEELPELLRLLLADAPRVPDRNSETRLADKGKSLAAKLFYSIRSPANSAKYGKP